MATEISRETIDRVITLLKQHGFGEALTKTSVQCIVEGIDADDYTYSVCALFFSTILKNSMRSHSDPNKQAALLHQNSHAMIDVLAGVCKELAREMTAEMEVIEKVKADRFDAGEGKPNGTPH
jgi:hypothetical protein